MRKIILSMLVSLDGFVAGPSGDLDWVIADDDHHKYSTKLLEGADTLIFGRVTYQSFVEYWPNAQETLHDNEKKVAEQINKAKKIVFSRTLQEVEWNSTLMREVMPDDILKLKQESGKDIVIFGSPTIAQTFMRRGLVDEYHLLVQPVILGKGLQLYEDIHDRMKLQHLDTETFKSGVVLLKYAPIK
ncbi:MAG: dihydrofolate reductase family protein [Weeksellaceae bacterium]